MRITKPGKRGPRSNPTSTRFYKTALGSLVDQWLKERTVRAVGRTAFYDLYEDYQAWLEDNAEAITEMIAPRDLGDFVPNRGAFGMLLYHRDIPNMHISGKSYRSNIVLKEPADASQS